ncbi:hypothetical protein I5M27_09390 [Adhaeribacter sp. BT258]|uniref:Lipoprotein n=1 Tax=Adhaeribacter terrigena TaxID=2793070 RepID=A0ABS1C1B4_9BACT|nr:hypothetical protein [Adhaeribacter terrigena]MBK0403198.1 hypothetical protein [Adhaeribacter terrigena]
MKNLRVPKLSLLALAGLLAFASCKKDDDMKPEEAMVSAEDHARLETEMESVQDFVDAEAADPDLRTGNPSKSGNLANCATRTWNAATNTLTIDFGSTNCLCKDGKYRRGQIVAVFSGTWRKAGSTVVISLNNYFVNDNQHLGTKVITSLGNEDGTVNYKYTVHVQNASIVFTDGTTRNWNAHRQLERIAGQGTLTLQDDEYLVTGTSSGTNRRGKNYSSTIGTPLKKVFRLGCARTFIAGTVTITNSRKNSLELNYDPTGTEACDKTASVTYNGKTRLITLR